MKKKITLLFLVFSLALVPAIYSGLFLGTIRDPYGETKELPVALVASLKDQENPVYKNFLKSNTLKLKKESVSQAQEELKKGSIYGIIVFKDNFTQKIANFVKSQQPSEIELYISSGLSFSASKILRSIVTEFVAQSNDKISRTLISELSPQKISIPSNIGNVITLSVNDVSKVKNNSEALAPYFFILTLFVGAIFINQVFQKSSGWEEERLSKFYLFQFVFPFFFSVLQAIFLTFLAEYVLKFNVTNWVTLLLFMIFISFIFDSIVVAVNKFFPDLGALFVLFFLMFQTSMSGGSYPLALSGKFFQQIGTFLPMTYAIMGLRKIISLGTYRLNEQLIPLIIYLIIGQIVLILSHLYQTSNSHPKLSE